MLKTEAGLPLCFEERLQAKPFPLKDTKLNNNKLFTPRHLREASYRRLVLSGNFNHSCHIRYVTYVFLIFSFTSKTVETLVLWYRDLDLNSKT